MSLKTTLNRCFQSVAGGMKNVFKKTVALSKGKQLSLVDKIHLYLQCTGVHPALMMAMFSWVVGEGQ